MRKVAVLIVALSVGVLGGWRFLSAPSATDLAAKKCPRYYSQDYRTAPICIPIRLP
jgi:hypothetical protein